VVEEVVEEAVEAEEVIPPIMLKTALASTPTDRLIVTRTGTATTTATEIGIATLEMEAEIQGTTAARH
jgi:hypothetical protein